MKAYKNVLKLNKNKFQIRLKSIVFLGHIISSEGVKVDPRKVEAITKMPLPNYTNKLQPFLGMIKYLRKFIPNLAEVTSRLHTLLKKEVKFKFEKPQLDAVGKIKWLFTTNPSLKIFNPNLQTRLKITATSEWLSALLEQNHGTLIYPMVSCWVCIMITLRLRKRYLQIEMETLSIVFGVERFHEYLYGHKFTAISDQQPLKLIFRKSIVRGCTCAGGFTNFSNNIL